MDAIKTNLETADARVTAKAGASLDWRQVINAIWNSGMEVRFLELRARGAFSEDEGALLFTVSETKEILPMETTEVTDDDGNPLPMLDMSEARDQIGDPVTILGRLLVPRKASRKKKKQQPGEPPGLVVLEAHPIPSP